MQRFLVLVFLSLFVAFSAQAETSSANRGPLSSSPRNMKCSMFSFSLAISATMGLAFSANMFTLFLFYEVLTVSTYPLVAHKGTPEAIRGARTYLGILIGTSIGPETCWAAFSSFS